MTSPDVFFIFFKFWFSELLVGKRAKMAQNDKKLCLSSRMSGTVLHMIVVFGTHAKWWYLQHFLIFLQNFYFFFIFKGVKGQKMAQNDKTFCLWCLISQELHTSRSLRKYHCPNSRDSPIKRYWPPPTARY